jgi:predicted CoA-binding protein
MTQSKEQQILRKYKSIAVVGLSTNSEKPALFVPKYMKEQGYIIIGINPSEKGEILGQKICSSLREIPGKVDIVNIFRPSGEVPGIVEEAIAIGAKVVWMQEGIVHQEAAEEAEKAGLEVVMNRCIMKAHRQNQADSIH